jgi:hypothetical protein
MDFSDRHAKINKRLMESWGYSLDEKKTEKGFGEGTPPEGEWYDKKVVVMEDHDLDHPGMCCADAHSGQEHGAWATAQQQGRTEAPAVVSLEERAPNQFDEPDAYRVYMADKREKEEKRRKRQEKEEKRSAKKEGLEEGELPPGLEKYKKEKEGGSDESDDSSAEASSDDEGDIVDEPEEAPEVENERKKRDEPRNYVGRPGHVQNPLHEHEELVKRVVERVVARLQKS